MKKTPYLFICTFLLSFFFSLPFSHIAQAAEWVRADGMATIHKNRVDIARDKAIESAQRAVVEKAVGVMISSATEVENYQVKLDRILSESKGFINTYRIVSEKRAGDIYEVTLEADVGMGRLRDRLSAVELIMTRKAKPRMMIVMGAEGQKGAVAEAAMEKYFLAQGFRLVDEGSVRERASLERLSSAGVKEIAQIAHRYGAEVVILGRVEVQTRTFRMGDVEVQSHEVTVTGKVVNGDTGEVIATDAANAKGDWKAAAEQAAAELARRINDEVLLRWSAELANTATVKLLVAGFASYEELLRFKESLSSEVKGLTQVYQRAFSRGKAELDLEIKGNAESVADDIMVMTVNDKKIKIVEITQNRIEARLQP